MSYTQEMLVEARAALHQRSTGKQVTSVKYDGREVSYNAVSLEDLKAYVTRIERALSGAAVSRISVYATDRGFR